MTYRSWLLIIAAAGALPALVFLVLFVFVDRPKYRDRYAWLIAAVPAVAFTGFAIPLLVTLFPRLQFVLGVVVRGASVLLIWAWLVVYLTPGRARTQLTRYEPPGRGPGGGER